MVTCRRGRHRYESCYNTVLVLGADAMGWRVFVGECMCVCLEDGSKIVGSGRHVVGVLAGRCAT